MAMATKYRHLVAWGRMMGSYPYYVQAELEAAQREKAPDDAIYRTRGANSQSGPGEWRRFSDVTNENTRRVIEGILREMAEPDTVKTLGDLLGPDLRVRRGEAPVSPQAPAWRVTAPRIVRGKSEAEMAAWRKEHGE